MDNLEYKVYQNIIMMITYMALIPTDIELNL